MSIEDFINNDLFVKWVITNDPQLNQYWNDWLSNHSGQSEAFYSARDFVEKMRSAHDKNVLIDEEQIWQQIKADIHNSHNESISVKRASMKKVWWAVAAIFVLVVFLGLFYYTKNASNLRNKASVSLENNISEAEKYITKINNTGGVQTINLPDGSKVLLEPGSSLRYKSLFNEPQREVFLNGEAFFQVAKNKERLFCVYAANVQTKVLGTSFRIKILGKKEGVLVAVQTGKVSVSKIAEASQHGTAETLLLPNEQIVFNEENIPAKAVVANKELIVSPAFKNENFTFDNTSVTQIFEKLSNIYTIHIDYNKTLYANCRITTSLDDESFYDKLTILCKAIGATYMIENNEIRIEGSSCE